MISKTRVFIAGSSGMVGSSLVRLLKNFPEYELILKTRATLNLLDTRAVKSFFETEKIDIVIMAAAKVGGIQANIEAPGQFLFENLQIQNNIIHYSFLNKVKKLMFLGSSCIYPKDSLQPMKEEYLLDGKLEPTNEGYSIAKIAGLKLCEMYKRQYGFDSISIMPCNLYGPNDSFNLQHSHVLSALVKRFVDAKAIKLKELTLWGTGMARREFMHVDDLAKAVLFFLQNTIEENMINVGWGIDVTIKELAELIAHKTGFEGKIKWDSLKSDGMLKKCMDVAKMKSYGFMPQIGLVEGVEEMIVNYQKINKNI